MSDLDRYQYAATQAYHWALTAENMQRTVNEWEEARTSHPETLTDRQRWLLDNVSRSDLDMPAQDAVGRALMWAKVSEIHRPHSDDA